MTLNKKLYFKMLISIIIALIFSFLFENIYEKKRNVLRFNYIIDFNDYYKQTLEKKNYEIINYEIIFLSFKSLKTFYAKKNDDLFFKRINIAQNSINQDSEKIFVNYKIKEEVFAEIFKQETIYYIKRLVCNKNDKNIDFNLQCLEKKAQLKRYLNNKMYIYFFRNYLKIDKNPINNHKVFLYQFLAFFIIFIILSFLFEKKNFN